MDIQSTQPAGTEAGTANSKIIDSAVENLLAELELLEKLASTPEGQGQLDAMLGKPSNSDDLKYRSGYEQIQAAIQLAPPQIQQLIQVLQQLPLEVTDVLS